MKQKLYILGVVAAMITSTGAIFKVNHWPAAGILIVAGTLILVLLFLPAALINNYKAEGNKQNKVLYIVTYITCFVVFIAMLFKIISVCGERVDPRASEFLAILRPFEFWLKPVRI